MKRVVFGIMLILTLTLTGILAIAFNIRSAEGWSGTVYIRADGSMDPPGAPVVTYDNITYTLTGNISSSADGIIVERNNIIIDGAGYTLNGTLEYPFRGVALSGKHNVTIKNIIITNFCYGIYLNYSLNNSVIGNNIANNSLGIGLTYCSNNTVSGNNIANNKDGIDLYCSSNNTVSGNNITANGFGIWFGHCSNNTVSGNNIANNGLGIVLTYCSNNTVSGNNIANIYGGIDLYCSSNNTASRNNIANNKDGMWLYSSSNNNVYHNNFIDNAKQVDTDSQANSWDCGYPSGGNYWSDYNGLDSDYDGIGDTPYFIDENNQDNYPLMGMCFSFNTSYGYAVDFVSNSTISDFSFNISPIEVYPPEAILTFNVSGKTGTKGFLRICIPKVLLNSPYVVRFDGEIITNTTYPCVRELPCSNETYEYLYINYTHSKHIITITGTTLIPEFSSSVLITLFMTVALLAVIVCRRKRQ